MAVTLGRTRLMAHPLALMFPLAAVLLGTREDGAALFVGLTVHEGAHLLAAKALGISISQLRLMPFGGAISMENPYGLPPGRLLAVAAAGPLGNALALVAGAALAHWQVLSPAMALALLRVNLVLMGFNLLPALPLDGGRMLYALLFSRVGRARAASMGIWLGRAVAVALLVLAVAPLIIGGRFNLSCAMAAVFILSSAADERKALSDARAQTLLRALAPLAHPVPARLWAVDGDCSVKSAMKVARPDAVTLFAVYKDSRLMSITDDRRLIKWLLERNEDAKIGEIRARPLPPG